ncbi:MAG TPA: transglutaminase family protein [Gemmataceae bacterium]|jgi:transglutaminase-like putative cysteine protease|nr:transglutaminase family protein [Gemmataceae bacterium]
MFIRIGYELVFDVPAPVPMLLMLYTHPSRATSLRRADWVRVEPEVPVQEFTDWFGNRCGRIVAPAGRVRLWNDTVVEDSGLPDPVHEDACQHAVEDLPAETLRYLLASRYCEVDRLSDIAWQLFGTTAPGWARVQAICDWVHDNVCFGYEHARPTKTAYEVFTERAGVCRDFMHLAIGFCRCLNIPARYATGYLGDIAVPPAPFPMDFSAWFEVFLDSQWHTFDARHNVPRVGRVLMARGRDAVDVALTTSFGPAQLEKFTVWTDEVGQPHKAAPVPSSVR